MNAEHAAIPATRVAVAVLRRGGSYLLCQRKRGGRYALKWEFPGGKLEPGETPEQCLARELEEELALLHPVIADSEIQRAYYEDGGMFEVIYFYLHSVDGTPVNRVFESIGWFVPAELAELDILEGNRDIIRRLAEKA